MLDIAGILHNAAKDTWHPIFFRISPMPGGITEPLRVKSTMHHTSGFTNKQEAVASVSTDARFDGVPLDENWRYEWDGEGIPVVVSFIVRDGDRVRLA